MNPVVSVPIQNTEKTQPLYVQFSDYSKLKSNYEKLKSKYGKLTIEKKSLKEMVDNMIINYEKIQESKKNTEILISNMQDSIKIMNTHNSQNTHNTHKPKEEYSTTTSFVEYIKRENYSNLKKSSKETVTLEKEMINTMCLKKIEELEFNYNEMSKCFNNTVRKYKLLKEDYENSTSNNTKLLQQIHLMNKDFNIIANELNARQLTIDRFKEIDKCLVDSTINTLVLNTHEHRPRDDLSGSINKTVPYVMCEPVPSFLKFINKAY